MKVTVDAVRCKGCGICLAFCPKNVFSYSKKRNTYGTPTPEAAREKDCIACRLCEKLCPDAAIQVDEEETK